MSQLIVGAAQIACGDDLEANLGKIETHVREAARRGAKLVVLQELFEGPYFCIDIDAAHNKRAKPFKGHATVARLAKLAKELGVVPYALVLNAPRCPAMPRCIMSMNLCCRAAGSSNWSTASRPSIDSFCLYNTPAIRVKESSF